MLPQVKHWPKRLHVPTALATLVAVGVADYATGHDILCTTFYLIPVALAAWTVGRRFGIIMSLLSVGLWRLGDFANGATYRDPFVPIWNSTIILLSYLVVVWLLTHLHGMYRDLEERVRLRT